MDERSRSALITLGATLASLGAVLLAMIAVSETEFSWWVWGLGWIGVSLGLLISLFQIHAVETFVSRPWRSLKRSRAMRRVLEARYRQSLLCNTCGHVFNETVMNTSGGWLEYEGAQRTCPSCGGETQGFQSLGSVPLNRAARKRGPL